MKKFDVLITVILAASIQAVSAVCLFEAWGEYAGARLLAEPEQSAYTYAMSHRG